MKIITLLLMLFPLLAYSQHAGGSGDGYHAAAFSESLSTGINNYNQNSIINIYPNPSTAIINIQTTSNEQFTYNIYNSLGSVISSGKCYNQVDVSKLSSGTYLLLLTDKNSKKLASTKFLKE